MDIIFLDRRNELSKMMPEGFSTFEMKTLQEFMGQFRFDPLKMGFVGVEREQFVVNPRLHCIIPNSEQYLEFIRKYRLLENRKGIDFGYELSACQLETKIGPCPFERLLELMTEAEGILDKADVELGLARINMEVAPAGIPLTVYPDPTGRYQAITEKMPLNILDAACRVAATHIHIGMKNMEAAIETYNRVIAHTDELMRAGDGSNGERLKLYKMMAPLYKPVPIASKEDFYQKACEQGFVDNPRSCWGIIRISIHGTIEFRMFGATPALDQIMNWTKRCYDLCFV